MEIGPTVIIATLAIAVDISAITLIIYGHSRLRSNIRQDMKCLRDNLGGRIDRATRCTSDVNLEQKRIETRNAILSTTTSRPNATQIEQARLEGASSILRDISVQNARWRRKDNPAQ